MGSAKKGIGEQYLALYEWMTTRVPRVAVRVGSFRFPKGGAAKWGKSKHRWEPAKVGVSIERWRAELEQGVRFFDVKIDGDDVEVVSWDWREDHESLGRSFDNALEVAAKLGAKGSILEVARFGHGDCTWTTFKLAGKKCNVDEGDTDFESERMQSALAKAGPPFRAWLDKHPETKKRFERSGMYGYVDREGKEAIPFTLSRAYEFSQGIACVHDGTHARLMTRDGTILPGKHFLTDYFLNGLAPVAHEQDKYGYANAEGTLVIPPKYERAECFRGPLAVVTHQGKKRWITPRGELVGDPIEYTHGFSEDRAWVYRYDIESYGCIDAKAKPAFEARFYATAAFSDGLAAIVPKKGDKWGYCDREGKIVIAPEFDEAHPFSEGRAAVKVGKKFRLIDKKGKLLGEIFDGIQGPMSEGMIAIRKKGKWGFADDKGKTVIPTRYAEAYGFFEDRAYVRVKDRWGHIDRKGKIAIPIDLEWTNRYRDGLAPAKKNGLYGFLDREGTWVVAPMYARMQMMFTDGLAWASLP